MNQALNTQWLKLEELRQRYHDAIQEANPEQLRFKASADSWNMLQIVEHLIISEKLSMDYLISKNYANARQGGRAGAFIRSLGLRILLLSPLRFKAPAGWLQPGENPDTERLLDEWKQVRAGMYEYLRNFPEEKLIMMIYRHPRAGWLDIRQALNFFEDHMLHHQKQLLRIRQAAGFPS